MKIDKRIDQVWMTIFTSPLAARDVPDVKGKPVCRRY
jgi:hypothetical protein